MGWLFTLGQTRGQLIDHLTRERDTCKTVAKFASGNHLWVVHEDRKGERFIVLYLLQNQQGYGWGYKDIDESMGPYYYSCPLKFLELAPKAANAEWREEVRKYHARRANAKGVKLGDTLILIKGCKVPSVVVTSVRPLQGTHSGVLYNISRRLVESLVKP